MTSASSSSSKLESKSSIALSPPRTTCARLPWRAPCAALRAALLVHGRANVRACCGRRRRAPLREVSVNRLCIVVEPIVECRAGSLATKERTVGWKRPLSWRGSRASSRGRHAEVGATSVGAEPAAPGHCAPVLQYFGYPTPLLLSYPFQSKSSSFFRQRPRHHFTTNCLVPMDPSVRSSSFGSVQACNGSVHRLLHFVSPRRVLLVGPWDLVI